MAAGMLALSSITPSSVLSKGITMNYIFHSRLFASPFISNKFKNYSSDSNFLVLQKPQKGIQHLLTKQTAILTFTHQTGG